MQDDYYKSIKQREREVQVKKTKIRIVVCVLILLFVLLNIIFHHNFSSKVYQETELYTEQQIDTNSIEDITESIGVVIDYTPLYTSIQELISNTDIVWSIYIKDLSTGSSISINNTSIYSASIIKLFVMVSCYNYIDDLIDNYCSLYNTDSYTATAKIEDLIYTMIVYSRNESYNQLVKLHSSTGSFVEGAFKINSYIDSLGCYDTEVCTTLHPADSSYISTGLGDNRTTVEDCGKILESIYEGKFNRYEDMIELLEYQESGDKISLGLPGGIVLVNKTGDTSSTSHDVGIIYGGETDYILCIMTDEIENYGSGNTNTMIGNISKLVYEYLNK